MLLAFIQNMLFSIGAGLFHRIPTYIIVFVILVGALGFYLYSERTGTFSKTQTDAATDITADVAATWVEDAVAAAL
jgi:hypothetical protein